jgi:hypothetical protein
VNPGAGGVRLVDNDPLHPLVHLALAGFEKEPIRADFLRRYSLDRLPNDPKLRQRAAEVPAQAGKGGFGAGTGSPGAISTQNNSQITNSKSYPVTRITLATASGLHWRRVPALMAFIFHLSDCCVSGSLTRPWHLP